jgi:hypothetical protein
MKILVTGNSQVSCLKTAYDADPQLLEKHGEVHFYVVPGGRGPYFYIEDDVLKVRKAYKSEFPPRVHPAEALNASLSSYDLIVVSALGFVDSGFHLKNPITRQGLIHDFSPKVNEISTRPLSKNCYEQLIRSSLRSQPGIRFLQQLSQEYGGRILVQPFPQVSSKVRTHSEWPLSMMYEKPMEAHKFFSAVRDDFMVNLCQELSVELLPCPNNKWHEDLFTPSELMSNADGVHPTHEYGNLILNQISDEILNSVLYE